jgi:hypothetical protein
VNPDGWQRIYQTPNGVPETDETDINISDSLEFPFTVSFEGKVKIDIGGISKILKLLN